MTVHKRFLTAVISVVFCLLFSFAVMADNDFPSYTITDEGWSLPVPKPYTFKANVTDFGGTPLSSPQDLYISADDRFFIADSGNNRVVMLNPDLSFDKAIGAEFLNSPKGLCVYENQLYIADSGNNRIAVTDMFGKLLRTIEKPDSELIEDEGAFVPLKLIVDDRGYLYVVCEGNENGLYMLDKNGKFRGYFGANKTQMSIFDVIVRMIYSKESRAGKTVKLPYSYINVGLMDGYIYASTTGANMDQVRRLSPSGGDALFGGDHIDFTDRTLNLEQSQNFVDVAIDMDGNLLVLDQTYCKIYSYDKDGQLLTAFGAKGGNRGCFLKPVSIALSKDNTVYVLDADRNCIESFQKTDFTATIQQANLLYGLGKYSESMEYWQKVLTLDGQYTIALKAMGRIHYRLGEYDKALDYAYRANDHYGYSEAFGELRGQVVSDIFPILIISVIGVLILLVVIKKLSKTKTGGLASRTYRRRDIFSNSFHVIFHPFDFFSDFKNKDGARYFDMFALLMAYIAGRIISLFATAYLFSGGPVETINWTFEIGLCVAPWLLLSLSNYGIATLAEGKAKFKEVMVGGAYSLSPLIWSAVPIALLTNALTYNEAGFVTLLANVFFALCVFSAFVFQVEVQNYSLTRSVVMLVCTLIGAVLVACLVVLGVGLYGQLTDFISQIFKEVSILAS